MSYVPCCMAMDVLEVVIGYALALYCISHTPEPAAMLC